VNWRKIKAEYIAGGISQRALADKYGVSKTMVMRKANKEHWTKARAKAESKALQRVEQKTAEKVADNAVLLQDIKTKLLQKLAAMVDAYPDANAAEIKHRTKSTEVVYRMRDIAAVYAALEDKTFKANIDLEDLSPLGELLRDD
jgi:transposase